jgi:hypothetical protein
MNYSILRLQKIPKINRSTLWIEVMHFIQCLRVPSEKENATMISENIFPHWRKKWKMVEVMVVIVVVR